MTADEFAAMAINGGEHIAELMRATALVWLDLRDRVLADLSVEDDEWPESMNPGRLKQMNRLMKTLYCHSESLAAGPSRDKVVWFVLNEQAILHGYTVEVNWSIRNRVFSKLLETKIVMREMS